MRLPPLPRPSRSVERRFAIALARRRSSCLRSWPVSPMNPKTMHRLGVQAARQGDLRTAAHLIAQAIEASRPVAAWCATLGAVLEAQGNLTGAAECYRQAAERNPRDRAVASRLAHVQLRIGLTEEAVAGYRSLVASAPEFAEGWFNLGVAQAMRQQAGEALMSYRRAIALEPNYAEAHNNVGILYQMTGHWAEAEQAYREALRARPGYVQPAYNLGLLAQAVDRLEEAAEAYREALRLEPSHAEAWNNLGNVLLASCDPRGALDCYEQALALTPGQNEARWNRAVAQLTLGDFAQGWPGYELRFTQPDCERRLSTAPPWRGEPLEGKRLLLWAEQGFGDSIQMIRFAREVERLGAEVLLECQAPLLPLLASAPGVSAVHLRGESPRADFETALMSLPGLLGAGFERPIPAPLPYVDPGQERRQRWRERLSAYASPRIGLVWQGNPRHRNDRNRSLPAQEAVSLVTEGAHWFSLQPDAAPMAGVMPLGEHLTNFAETAAAMESLDLIISVDTAAAHLAGALGRPVWLLLPHAPDWRWLLDRDDSPWYPTMRLFRQPSRGNWAAVTASVREALRARLPDLAERERAQDRVGDVRDDLGIR